MLFKKGKVEFGIKSGQGRSLYETNFMEYFTNKLQVMKNIPFILKRKK